MDDNSERIAALEARVRAAEAELDQFAYIVSHDLQAPVRTLQSFSRLLRGECADALTEDAEQYLQFIESAGRQVQSVLQAILYYSRARRLSDVANSVDLDEAWQQARAHCAPEVRDHIGPEQPGLGRSLGNREAMISVFQNLLSNAVANADASRPLRVRIAAAPAAPGQIRLYLDDNGRGIPADLHEAAFEVFRRVHATPSDTAGMGLAICRELIQRQNGRIHAEPIAEGGTRISIQLPASE